MLKTVHVCYEAPGRPAIELQCEEGEFIVVEEAVVGWSSEYRNGTNVCPRDREECTEQFHQVLQSCQGLQQCSVPHKYTSSDICKQSCPRNTNYFDGSYRCLSGK